MITEPATDDAKKWHGWGTALKPALEPITVARKPLIGTVSANVLTHGTGALNIDGSRVATDDNLNGGAYSESERKNEFFKLLDAGAGEYHQPVGRWPANLIHDGSDEVLAAFPDAKGQQGALTGEEPSGKMGHANCYGKMDRRHESDKSAARFFYCAKASRRDRNEGLDGFELRRSVDDDWISESRKNTDGGGIPSKQQNHHPTVKPTDLMRYLCRLVTPPSGTVLDPFMGSGSTGKAAVMEGFCFIGIERESEYVDIARARIADAQKKADAA
ncbi:site-specific DNA-methyltransferase [Pectobacterium aroidearum]|nr:site-specific DNA-methyltransferase [Pectobacterium aroidearum]UUE42956.1 site-specific DNA-methyltransferase [Pectobacterium aroidearum]